MGNRNLAPMGESIQKAATRSCKYAISLFRSCPRRGRGLNAAEARRGISARLTVLEFFTGWVIHDICPLLACPLTPLAGLQIGKNRLDPSAVTRATGCEETATIVSFNAGAAFLNEPIFPVRDRLNCERPN